MTLIETLKPQATVLSGLTQFFMLGLNFSWGNISVQIASNLKLHDPSIRSTDLTLGMSITVMFQALTLWIAPILFRMIDHRLILVIANCIGIGGVQLSTYMTTVTGVLMTQSVGWGMMMGLGQMTTIQCSLLWFPNQKGLISGMIIGMLGLSTIFINLFINHIINPLAIAPSTEGSDKYFHQDIAEGTPAMIREICYVFVVMTVFVVVMCFKPVTAAPVVNVQVKEELIGNGAVGVNQPKVSWRWKAIYSKHFFCVFVNNIFSMGSGTMMLSLYQSHGFLMEQGVAYMAAIGFIGSINNGVGRIFLAYIAEKYNYKGTYLSIVLTQLISLILLACVENVQVYVIANTAMFWGTGGHQVNTIVQFNKVQDKQQAGELQGQYFFSFLISNILNIPLKTLYQETSYLFMIMVLIGFQIVCLVNLMANFDFEDRKINLDHDDEKSTVKK